MHLSESNIKMKSDERQSTALSNEETKQGFLSENSIVPQVYEVPFSEFSFTTMNCHYFLPKGLAVD